MSIVKARHGKRFVVCDGDGCRNAVLWPRREPLRPLWGVRLTDAQGGQTGDYCPACWAKREARRKAGIAAEYTKPFSWPFDFPKMSEIATEDSKSCPKYRIGQTVWHIWQGAVVSFVVKYVAKKPSGNWAYFEQRPDLAYDMWSEESLYPSFAEASKALWQTAPEYGITYGRTDKPKTCGECASWASHERTGLADNACLDETAWAFQLLSGVPPGFKACGKFKPRELEKRCGTCGNWRKFEDRSGQGYCEENEAVTYHAEVCGLARIGTLKVSWTPRA